MRRPFTAFSTPRKPLKANLRPFLPLFLIFNFTQPLSAAALSSDDLLRAIELRRGSWTSLSAAVEFKFKSYSQSVASCKGSLLYNRLDEKIFLACQGRTGEAVFIFKTNDRNFELYLPSKKTLYKGNVFALENSPSIESHLNPLDLYRALKPAIFKASDLLSSRINPRGYSLTVKSGNDRLRKIEMTEEGDILREAYTGFDGKVALSIERFEFETAQSGSTRIVFPKQLRIKSSKDSNVRETTLEFQAVSFPASLRDELFEIYVPEHVSIEEVS